MSPLRRGFSRALSHIRKGYFTGLQRALGAGVATCRIAAPSAACRLRVIRDRCEPAACPAMSASTPIATVSQRPPCATWSNAGVDDGDEILPSAGLHKFRRHLLPLVPLIQATYRASRAIPELRAAPAGRVNCSGSDSGPDLGTLGEYRRAGRTRAAEHADQG